MWGPRPFATLALGAMLFLAACGGGLLPPEPSPPPSDGAPTAPPPTQDPVASPRGPVVPQVPAQPCCGELPLPPGPYALPGWLGRDLRLEVGDDWAVINDARREYLAFGRGENSVGRMDRLVSLMGTPDGTTDDEVVEHLEAMQTVRYDGPTETTSIAGFEADEMIGTALPNPDEAGDPDADIPPGVVDLDPLEAFVSPGVRLTTATPEARVRILVIEVGEEVLVAFAEAPPADAEPFFTDVDRLLDTLRPPD